MTTIPMGTGAYERNAAGVPEIKLLNRYAEQAPTNLKEHSMLLARAASKLRVTLDPGAFGLKSMRGNYFFGGLFDDSMFSVVGNTLYRIHPDLSVTPISGTIQGTAHPEVGWQKGAGFERLFISDGLLLQFYGGTTGATGTLTLTPPIVNGTDVIEIGGVYYTWGTSFSGLDAGTVSHPYVVNPLTDPLEQLQLAIMDSGTPGTDYSGTISGPNTLVMAAAADDTPPATTIEFTALAAGSGGNSITTTVTGGAALAFSHATLTDGGIDALQGVEVPDGQAVASLTQVSSYVLVSIVNTQQFYWVNPGEIVIDPLDFASKESSPDAIIAMRTTGDNAVILGEASTENWYATGNLDAPFLPIEGRVYQHGAIDGTACVVADAVMLVGDDMVAYSIGYAFGAIATWGVNRISNHGIEERIRRQVRSEQGLDP